MSSTSLNKDTSNWPMTLAVISLSFLTIFTYLQNQYSVGIHLCIFVFCIISMKRISSDFFYLLLLACLSVAPLMLLAIGKETITPTQIFGIFLHYTTWPLLLIGANEQFSYKQEKFILRIIFILCIIGNIASLKMLFVNADVSHILAGTSREAKDYLYALGVGGYGYVYAMSFLTYGAISWLIKADKFLDKIILITFLITNYLFILYASYTIAIIMTIGITIAALTSNMPPKRSIFILFVFLIFTLVFGKTFLTIGVEFADRLELSWVSNRLGQLLNAQSTGDFSGLKRSKLYMRSFNSLLKNPLIGNDDVGGHSQFLDLLGSLGILGSLFPFFLYRTSKKCLKIANHNNLAVIYIAFFIFSLIDTCSAMQLPVVIFFVCPLISNIINLTDKNNTKADSL